MAVMVEVRETKERGGDRNGREDEGRGRRERRMRGKEGWGTGIGCIEEEGMGA